MNDPGHAPNVRGQLQIRPLPGERLAELAAHQLGERLDWNQETLAGRMPEAAVVRDAAAGDQAVDVGVVVQLLRPGVEHGEYAHLGADITRVAGQLDDRLGRHLHQQRVAVTLVGAQHGAQLGWDGDGDVEVGRIQQLGGTSGEPALGLLAVASRTASVAAGMVGIDLGAARFAAPEMATQRGAAAGDDVGDRPAVRGQHAGAVPRDMLVGEAPADVGEIDHGGRRVRGRA